MGSKGQKYRKYSSKVKKEILEEYWSGKSSTYLAEKYGVSDNTIRMWSFNVKRGKAGGKKGRPKVKELTLEDYKERYEILKKYQAFLQARRGKK